MKMSGSLHTLQRFSGEWPNLQHRLMNWQIRGAALLAASVLATSCVPAPSYGSGPGPAPGPGWTGSESSAYRAGHSDGSRDKRQGRRYNPYGGDDRFPPATRDDYVRGYNAGYKNANDNPWSRRRAYELGQNHGHRDRQAGRSMNPDRHSSEVPAAVRTEFRRGYRDGWNSLPTRPISPRPAPY